MSYVPHTELKEISAGAKAIILTGGIAHSQYCMDLLRPQIDFLAPVVVMPGENEISSLAYNAIGVLTGKLKLKEY